MRILKLTKVMKSKIDLRIESKMRYETAEKIRVKIEAREPFASTSYMGQSRPDGIYELWHHNTRMARFGEGGMEELNLNYYSTTTSIFQGIIIRTLSNKEWDKLKELYSDNKKELKRISKMRGKKRI